MSTPESRGLACNRCKNKKLRCSRDRPICGRCRNNGAECVYSLRQPRKRQPRQAKVALNDILERLNYLERSAGSISNAPPWPSLPSASATPNSTASIEHQIPQLKLKAPSSFLENLVGAATRSTLNVLNTNTQSTPSDEQVLAPLEEVLASLRDSKAVSQYATVSIDGFTLPEKIARLWVLDCFDLFSDEYFIGLANRKTVSLMPEITSSPYITIDCSLQIVYYHALYQGWRAQNQTPATIPQDCGQLLYRQCVALIPRWERDQKTTFMDLIATSALTWMAVEHFDYQVAFEFFEAATILIRELGLHRLDEPDCSTHHPELAPYLNEVDIQRLRRGFWQMFHFEIFFRLYHDRPSLMTKQRFFVDLPGDIAQGMELDQDHIGTMTFMLTSRICFITKDYLDMLDATSEGDSISSVAVSAFCDRIEAYISDWEVENLMQNSDGDLYRVWAFADPLINGLTTVILMERNLAHVSDQYAVPPVSARAATAAGRIINALFLLSNQKQSKTLSPLNLFSFYSFVAFFTLFHNLLHQLNSQERVDEAEDIVKVLSEAAELLAALADKYDRFTHVLKAVESLVSISKHLLRLHGINESHNATLPPLPGIATSTAPTSYFDLQPQLPSDFSDFSGLFQYAHAIESDLFGGDREMGWRVTP